MNDEAAPATAAAPLPNRGDPNPGESLANSNGPGAADKTAEEARAKIGAKRAASLKDLMRNLDVLIYTELATVYYMDMSLLRFTLRAFMQLVYLTPKPPIVPTPPNLKDRPYIGAIFGTNIMCFLLHLWLSRPSAGEATRGFLHGGLLIDFVGQKGPTSKMHLLLLDVTITILQAIMLAVVVEEKNSESKKKRRGKRGNTRGGNSEARGSVPTEAASSTNIENNNQDHDAEERGLRRPAEPGPILRSTNFRELDSAAASAELLDRLRSGQALSAKFYVFDVVRDEFQAYGDAQPATANQDQAVLSNSAAGLAAALARSSSAARIGIRQMANG